MSEIKKALELVRGASASELEEALGSKRAAALCQALREPTPMENVAGYVNVGWSSVEVEFLQAALAPNEEVVSFNTWSATTNRRVIDRAKLRADARPCSWTRIDRWLEQFPIIPDRQEEG